MMPGESTKHLQTKFYNVQMRHDTEDLHILAKKIRHTLKPVGNDYSALKQGGH